MLWWIISGLILYCMGCSFTLGLIGGIREGAEGIGDGLKVIFWPIMLTLMIISIPFMIAGDVGDYIRRQLKW